MKKPLSLTIGEPQFKELLDHLFPGDCDEHGAVIAAGISETDRGTRLLTREVFLARDGIDFIPGNRGYRQLTTQFVAEKSGYCANAKLCYLAVHNHPGVDSVEFSDDDNRSHERGYPALLDVTNGGPVGALVFAENAVAGDIWTPQGRFPLDHLTVVGSRMHHLYPMPARQTIHANPMYDRHARMFGDIGQSILGQLKVGIIGLGGGGSLINEWLSRLGVGHIVGVDFDRVDLTNLPRIVGATRFDALSFLTGSNNELLRKIGKRFAKHKVKVARRVAMQANASICYDAIIGDVMDEPTARLLIDVDFLFLASDSMQSRLLFNVLVHQYLIPGAQVGVKISVDKHAKVVTDIHVATRPVLPYADGGCLQCQAVISASRLQEEALSEGERKTQRYIDFEDIAEPSVITLNVLSAAQAVNDLMMMFTGLYNKGVELLPSLNFTQERKQMLISPRTDPHCITCGTSLRSRFARGDRMRLPTRMPRKK